MSGLKKARDALYADVRVLDVSLDEAGGEMVVGVATAEHKCFDIVYEGMFYSQIDERAVGMLFTCVTEVLPEEHGLPDYQMAIARLYEDCAMTDAFLQGMFRRGSHLYAHQTQTQTLMVLAKRIMAYERQGERAPGDGNGLNREKEC